MIMRTSRTSADRIVISCDGSVTALGAVIWPRVQGVAGLGVGLSCLEGAEHANGLSQYSLQSCLIAFGVR
jgi:hypothetical protein